MLSMTRSVHCGKMRLADDNFVYLVILNVVKNLKTCDAKDTLSV